ncbi:MAG: M48 family metallopeptidase [Treponema sp.]|jgi:predicted metal-dependent hydrolase|nr:M48 family metallopeptidase [Treponema sp.]
MTEILQVGSQRIEVTYKPIKNLRLTVYPPDGRIKVSAPQSMTADFIRHFAASRMAWIEKQQNRYRFRAADREMADIEDTQFIWGVPHRLVVIEARETPKAIPRIRVENVEMTLSVRPGTSREKQQAMLDAWRLSVLKEAAPGAIEKWEGIIGVKSAAFSVRKMKSRWGSCNCARRTIRLNSEIVKRPPECLEYVIAHELIHLIEPSHNRNFYRLLSRYMPGWKIIHQRMNSELPNC